MIWLGYLNYYRYVNNYFVHLEPVELYTPGTVVPDLRVDDAKTITLSEFNPKSKLAITAHRVKDYRKKSNSLILLPEVDILFDKLIEGSEYFGRLLPY